MAADYGSPQANALLGGTAGATPPAASSPAPTSDYGSDAANALLGGAKVSSKAALNIPADSPVLSNYNDYGSGAANSLLGGSQSTDSLVKNTKPADTSSLFSGFTGSTKAPTPKTALSLPPDSPVLSGYNTPTQTSMLPSLKNSQDFTKESSYLDAQTKTLKTTSAQLDADNEKISSMKASLDAMPVDKTSQKSIDNYNSDAKAFNDAVKKYQSDAKTFNDSYGAYKTRVDSYNGAVGSQNTQTAYTGPSLTGQSIESDKGDSTPINSFQEILSNAKLPTFLIKNEVTDAIGSTIDDAADKLVKATQGFMSEKLPDRLDAGFNAIHAIGDIAFLLPSAVFGLVKTVPGGKQVLKPGEDYLNMVGDALKQGIPYLIHGGDIEAADKDQTSQDLGDLVGFATQGFLAGKSFETITPIIKAKVDQMKIGLTKDFITNHTPAQSVYFDSAKIKDIWKTGKLLTDSEKADILKVLGADKDNAALHKAFQDGLTIGTDARTIVTLEDKPYWAKIKSYFGADSAPEILSDTGAKPAITVRGNLPTGRDVHPILKDEVRSAVDTHGTDLTHQALQENLGLSPEAAAKVINDSTIPKTPAEIAKTNTAIMNNVAPETILEKERAPSVLQVTDANGESTMQAIRPEDFEKFKALIDSGDTNRAQALQEATGNSYHLSATKAERMIKAGVRPVKGYADHAAIASASESLMPSQDKEAPIKPILGRDTNLSPTFTSMREPGAASISTRYTSPSSSKNLTDIYKDYTKVLEFAQANEQPFIHQIAKATGLEPDVRIKSKESFNGKVARYKGKELSKIKDVLAGSVTVKMSDMTSQLENIKKNFEVVESRNYFDHPTDFGYKGINITVKLSNGMLAEIQIHTPESLKISNKVHSLYEKWRNKDYLKLTSEQIAEKDADEKKAQAISEKYIPNTQGGFIDPGKMAEDIAKVAKKTGDYIEQTNRNIKAAKNLDDTLYKTQKNIEADQIETNKLLAEAKSIPQFDRLAIDAYRDTLEAGLTPPKLTEAQQSVNDGIINPLLKDATEKRTFIKGNGIELDSENYNPRLVKGKGSVIDRLVATKDRLTGGKGGGKRSILAKSASSLKHRTYMSLTDANGNRSVVSFKDGKLTRHFDKDSVSMGAATRIELNKGTFQHDGKTYKVGEATKAEIERHTDTQYYHDPVTAAILTHENITQVYRAVQVLENYKASDEFQEISFKRGEGLPPEGWKPSPIDQFRDYFFEPKTWKVLNAYKNELQNNDPMRALTAINNLLLNTMFLSPVKHFLNVGVMAAINRGATRFLNPMAYPTLFKTSFDAITDVITQNDSFLKVLREGASFMSTKANQGERRADILANLGEKVSPTTKALQTGKKVIGAITPFNWVHAIVWPGTDMFMYQGILESLTRGGVSVKDATPEQISAAIQNAEKFIPNYRLSVTARQLPTWARRNAVVFASWRQSLYRVTYGLGKSAVTGDQPFKDTMGSKAWKARGKAFDKMVLIGFMSLIVWPYLQDEWKKLTNNANASVFMPSILGLIDNVNKLASGQIDISQYTQTLVDLPPGTKEIIQQALNVDFFTKQAIRDKTTTPSEQIHEGLVHAETSSVTLDEYNKVNNGALSPTQFGESLVGLNNPDSVQTKLVGAVTTAQNKIEKLDSATVSHVTDIYNQAKKAGFGTPAADKIVSVLNASDYAIYKDLKAVDSAKSDVALKDKIQPIVEKAYQLGFGTPAADALVKDLSPEEMSAYNSIKTILFGAKGTGVPTYNSGTTTNDTGIIGSVMAYANAIRTDPLTAFERIFTGQRILRTENGTIIVERNDKIEANMKKQLGGTTEMTLDHIKSFELGGDNSTDNMWLVPKAQAADDDQVENYLGKALSEGKITGQEAQEYEVRYKKGADAAEINGRTQKLFDSAGTALTFDEIKQLVK